MSSAALPSTSAFARAMNHLLEQREVRIDRLAGFGEPNRDDRFSQIGAIAYLKWDCHSVLESRLFVLSTFPRELGRK